MELKDYLNMGYDEQLTNLDISKFSVQELEKALQETEDLDTIKQIIRELEHRTEKKSEMIVPGVVPGKTEPLAQQESPEKDVPSFGFHIAGSVFFFIMAYLFLVISGVSLFLYWIDDYTFDIELEAVAVQAVIGFICLGFGHITSLLVSICKGIQKNSR
ncbi:MAG: hypothetical protein M0Q99_11130 [Candidatus Cloacimonetes bacterium]|nr:hypothetical protein [Candidatus Cloacimonadota bacterium]MDD3543378.1 hypothetical protein [Petrimonas sp.]